ncbi:hypothetical protein KSS87_001995, partial [Heliosperma pusillum]
MTIIDRNGGNGNKITNEDILDYIHKSLGPDSSCFGRSIGVISSTDYSSIELLGRDRPGLLSELSTVLAQLKCNVVNAEVWTHNTRAAAVMRLTDQQTGCAITDPERLAMIKELLCNVLGSCQSREAKTEVTHVATHAERRLHQMLFGDRDYERAGDENDENERQKPDVSVVN